MSSAPAEPTQGKDPHGASNPGAGAIPATGAHDFTAGDAEQGRSAAAALQNDATPDPMAINQTAAEEPPTPVAEPAPGPVRDETPMISTAVQPAAPKAATDGGRCRQPTPEI